MCITPSLDVRWEATGMAGRDLPGPNSLDRKTKFQRNFNQLWWESERERGKGKESWEWGESRKGGGRRVVGAARGLLWRSPGRSPWCGLVTVGTPCLPSPWWPWPLCCHRGWLCPAEPSQLFSWRGDGLPPLDTADPHHAHVIFSTTVESVHMVLNRLSANSTDV